MGVLLMGAGLPACASEQRESGGGPFVPDGVPGVDASISFAHEGTVALSPGEIFEIVVVGKPAAPYGMTFLLLGESLDASLDKTKAVADSDGVARVKLRAPNGSTNFTVAAKIKEGPTAELQVAVSDQGFGAVAIEPIYLGEREAREWVASAVAGKTCEQLSETFPEDPEGALTAAAEPGDELVIPVAPVGPNLAVYVRGGHYMWGCVDAPQLVASGTLELDVSIVNAPIQADEALLDIDMAFAPDPLGWQNLLAEQRALMLTAFEPQNQATALLDAMEQLSCDPIAFAQGTSQNQLDMASHLTSFSVDLSQSIDGLVSPGLAAQPPQILGQVAAVPGEPGYAIFSLSSIGTATPAILGVPTDYQVSVVVDPDDTARVGGTLFWLPSRYIGNAILDEALSLYAQHDSMAEVLGEAAHCDVLALSSAPGCDSAALPALCEAALGLLWSQALDASAVVSQHGEIPFSASGGSEFDDYAKLTGFSGSWLGHAKLGSTSVQVSGAVTAITPEIVTP